MSVCLAAPALTRPILQHLQQRSILVGRGAVPACALHAHAHVHTYMVRETCVHAQARKQAHYSVAIGHTRIRTRRCRAAAAAGVPLLQGLCAAARPPSPPHPAPSFRPGCQRVAGPQRPSASLLQSTQPHAQRSPAAARAAAGAWGHKGRAGRCGRTCSGAAAVRGAVEHAQPARLRCSAVSGHQPVRAWL